MPDYKNNVSAVDRKTINVNEDYERRDWAKKLGMPEEELAQLVKEHGTLVEAVKNAIEK